MARVEYIRNENIDNVLKSRYLHKREDGVAAETPEDMLYRVAKLIASAEKTDNEKTYWEEMFYNAMALKHFMPNSPTLMNAGRKLNQLSACFVIPIDDSIDGIMKAATATAIVQKSGGGTGFTLDRLRPTGDYIYSSGGTTSGPISFWRILHQVTESIQQGSFRRGANMMMLSLRHPDILKFINIKQDLTQFTSYNISVKLTDQDMQHITNHPEYSLQVVNPRTDIHYVIPKTIDGAKLLTYTMQDLIPVTKHVKEERVWTYGEIWKMICHNAWQTGEPGLCFIDLVQRTNTINHKAQIETSNPCGEQTLPPWGNCSLGSINIAAFVKDDRSIDVSGLKTITETAVRFLDNSIDVNNYPVAEIKEQALNDRRIGVGIMGFADALFKMRVRYNSPEGYAVAENVMGYINKCAHDYSEKLAAERGSFLWWEGSHWQKQNRLMRNCMLTNVAPTGTISILADCSGGLEPLFSLGFWRQVLNGQILWQGNQYFDAALKEAGVSDADKQVIYDYVAGKPGSKQEGAGTLFGCPVKLPEWMKTVFVTARDIPVRDHITMQAAFQKHVDNAVSKTVNLPETAKVEEVADAFLFAYKNGCKGITVYRDKCRANQPMSVSVSTDKKPVQHKPTKKKLPRVGKLVGYKFTEPLGDVYVNIRHNDHDICEMFANTERSNTLVSLYVNALSRVLSTAIRYGVPAEAFEFLEKMHDPEEQPPIIGPFGVTTGPEAFGRALKFFRMGLLDDQSVVKHHKDTFGELEKLRQELNKLPENYKTTTGTLCPECTALMYPNPGCSNGMLCYSCGYTTGHCKG